MVTAVPRSTDLGVAVLACVFLAALAAVTGVALFGLDVSATLGEAALQVRSLIRLVFLAMAALLAAGGIYVAARVRRSLSDQEDALRASEERYRQSFESNLAGMYRATQEGRILEGNTALARILGRSSAAELRGLLLRGLETGGAGEEADASLVDREVCLRRLDGTPVWALVHENLLVSAEADAVREGSLIDVTERRRTHERQRFQATHDALTGLPNRVLFFDRLEHAIRHAQRNRERIAVLFVDLDDFKSVNDSLGHAAGDDVLVEVASRMTACLRADDTVGRLGGDEFLFLFPGIAADPDAAALAAKVLDRISDPLACRGRELRLAASVGIGMYPEDGADAETIVASADAAMYRAKASGRRPFRIAGAPPASGTP